MKFYNILKKVCYNMYLVITHFFLYRKFYLTFFIVFFAIYCNLDFIYSLTIFINPNNFEFISIVTIFIIIYHFRFTFAFVIFIINNYNITFKYFSISFNLSNIFECFPIVTKLSALER